MSVIYSEKSHRKIVHMSGCAVIKRIAKKNRKSFDSLDEALVQGYHLCKCCPALAIRYRKERKAIDSFCESNHFQIELKDGVLNVNSRNDCWRIIINGNNRNLFLYHKNKDINRVAKRPNLIQGYHSQAYRSETIIGYLEYIKEHDAFRDEHPYKEHTVNGKTVSIKPYIPQTLIDKYGEEWFRAEPSGMYKRVKGTKRYRKEQKRKKRQERRAKIIRVYTLLDELAAKQG